MGFFFCNFPWPLMWYSYIKRDAGATSVRFVTLFVSLERATWGFGDGSAAVWNTLARGDSGPLSS